MIEPETTHKIKNTIVNNKARKVLSDILDSKSRPFIISYTQALNAMSKIGILELQPKRKGDFRKLVRQDSQKNIISKVFAYRTVK